MKALEYVVTASDGLHARPASRLVKTLLPFKSEVLITDRHGNTANAKSVVALLSLDVSYEDRIRVSSEDDAVFDVLQTIPEVISNADVGSR